MSVCRRLGMRSLGRTDDDYDARLERFITEARLQDLDGAAIGDALTTIASHLRETGEPVAAAPVTRPKTT